MLYSNGRIASSKKTIAELIHSGEMAALDYILIPIWKTSATYVAVDRDIFLTGQFSRGVIRYHLQYRLIDRSLKNNPMEYTKYDYYPTFIDVTTYEELYQAIYQVGVFFYNQELFGYTDRIDSYWHISVEDIEVTLWNADNKVMDHIEQRQLSHQDMDVPFHYERFNELVEKLYEHFGIFGAHEGALADSYYLRFYQEGDHREWKITKTPVELLANITHVGRYNPSSRGFVILKRDEYDAALRLQNGFAYISPIYLWDESNPYDCLPIAHYFNLPKYRIGPWNGEEDIEQDPGFVIFETLGPFVYDTFAISLFDPDDIIAYLDHSQYFMSIYHEGIKVMMADSADEDNLAMFHDMGTVLYQLVTELDSSEMVPSENNFIIYSDPFEDYPPSIKEVTYLLQLHK